MITMIADDVKSSVGAELYAGIISMGTPAEYVSLKDMNVKACLGCNGCTYKSYGKCVVRDDADLILPKLIRSDAMVIVSPVTFGSYSFRVKRVMDKLGLIMDRHYYVKNGELVKNSLIGEFRLYAVGVAGGDGEVDGFEAEAFKKLVRENIKITQSVGKAFVVGAAPTSEEKEKIIREVVRA